MGRGLLGVISTTAMALPIEFSKMKHKKVRDEKVIENIKENAEKVKINYLVIIWMHI